VFSVSLDLPEFEVVKQVFLEDCILLHVEKNSMEECCPFCGFSSSNVHDWRTRKVRDLSELGKPLFLFVRVNIILCLLVQGLTNQFHIICVNNYKEILKF
jgi:transposase